MNCEVLLGQYSTVFYQPSVTDHTGYKPCGKAVAGEIAASEMAPNENGKVQMCQEHLDRIKGLRPISADETGKRTFRLIVQQGETTAINKTITFARELSLLTWDEIEVAMMDGILKALDCKMSAPRTKEK